MGIVECDWTDESAPKPGVYQVEVRSVEDRHSSKGDRMLVLILEDVGSVALVCREVIMLAGKGRSMGMRKLVMIGVENGCESFDTDSLVGMRCYVDVREEVYKGATQLKVDISGGQDLGYWPDGAPPDGVEILTVKDLPF